MAQIRQSTIRAYDKGVQEAIKVFTHQGYEALISQCIACEKSKYSRNGYGLEKFMEVIS